MARRAAIEGFPTRPQLIEATFNALVACGGSATNQEIMDVVINQNGYSEKIVSAIHADGRQSKLGYELRWARTYLKSIGIITNSERGVWVICPAYMDKESISWQDEYSRYINENNGHANVVGSYVTGAEDDVEKCEERDPEPWRGALAETLLKMDPYDFEAFSARVLRECGFTSVKVTKPSRDGGIDGTGKLLLNGLISINVAFQCKRFKGTVGSREVTQFRGSMNNCEKGIIITTGVFSEDAKKEAVSAGKQPIDLIDGEALIDLLIDKQIGVRKVDYYIVDEKFIKNPECYCDR